MNRPIHARPRCAAAMLTAAVLATTLATTPLVAQDLVIQAARIVVAADTVLTDGRLLVRQGKVAWVGDDIPADARARARLVDYGDATIVPGFVLAQSTLTQDADLAESALAFTPDLRAAEGFDPWRKETRELPRCGVTAVGLSASPRNVAGGIGALVKPGREVATIPVPELHLTLSLTQAARNEERPPTSMMGAIDLLRTTFTIAKAGTHAGPDAAVLRQVLSGSRAVFVHADAYTEICGALDLARDFGFTVTLVGARDAEKLLPRLVEQKVNVVLDSLLPESRLEQLTLPTRLAEAGLPFCFGGRPELLRLSAALAVRNGLDRRTALQALTRMPATLLGQQASIGSLRQDHAADFLVFRGDPLDLDAKHLATWIDGVRVYGEEPPAKKPAAEPAATVAGDN